MGVEQVKRLPKLIEARRENAKLLQTVMSNHPDIMIQEEIGESSWFGFSLIIRPHSQITRKELVKKLINLGFECRPIVAGNFAKNEVVKYFNSEVHGSLKNAEYVDQKGLFGVALFYSEKYNERNTDTDSAGTQYLLSGKRHATGMEFNFAGRITPAWEVFYNHTWIPEAKIDESSIAATGDGAQGKGDRPALTPKHSASLWSTYRINTTWRVGGGLNYRGEQNPDGARTKVAAAFTTVDAMAEYAINDANLLKFNVSNLTNKLYADTLYRGFYGPGAPRRVELSWKSMF